jgi:hypothetical protein
MEESRNLKLGLPYKDFEGFWKGVFNTSADLIQFLFSEHSTSSFIYIFTCPVKIKSLLGMDVHLTTTIAAADKTK